VGVVGGENEALPKQVTDPANLIGLGNIGSILEKF